MSEEMIVDYEKIKTLNEIAANAVALKTDEDFLFSLYKKASPEFKKTILSFVLAGVNHEQMVKEV